MKGIFERLGLRGVVSLSFFAVVLLIPLLAVAETPYEPLWIKQMGNSEYDIAFAVDLDSSGNAYVAGRSNSDFGSPNAVSTDIILIKYAPDGTRLWTQQLGSSSLELVWGVAVDGSGNAYVAGDTYGYLEGSGSNHSDPDIFLSKYDANGNYQWTRQLQSPSFDDGRGVAVDDSGHIYVTGSTDGNLGGSNAGESDIILIKYAPDGTRLWVRQLGSSSSDYAYAVAVDGSGNAYVAGETSGDLGGPHAGGFADFILVKYDTNGNYQWTEQLGTSSFERAWGVAVDGSGNAYVTGYTSGDLGGPSVGAYDLFLVKYAPDGTRLWVRQLGSSSSDYAYAVAVDGSGNAYVAGETYGDLGGPHAGGFTDFFLVKYDTNGNYQWTEQLGTSSFDRAFGVAVDGSGNAYVTGFTSGDLGGPNAGSYDIFVVKLGRPCPTVPQWTRYMGTAGSDYGTGIAVDSSEKIFATGWTSGFFQDITGPGYWDYFLLKFDADANVLWKILHGSSSYDWAFDIAVDSSGNAYVAGITGGDLNGNSSAGGSDVFLIKYGTNGNKLWTRQMGSTEADYAYGIDVDSNGNAYVTGFTLGGLDGNINAGGADVFLIKYDTNGNKLWTRQMGSTSHDDATDVVVDSDGKIYVTGYTAGNLDGYTNAGGSDIFIAKFDTTGSNSWTRQMGSAELDYAYGIDVDSIGNVYVAGTTWGDLGGNGDVSGGSTEGANVFLIKYDADGNRLWTRQRGSSSHDWASDVTVDVSGNSYVVGSTWGNLDGNTNAGGSDIFLIKFDTDGAKLCTIQYAGSSMYEGPSAAVTNGGNIYIIGNGYYYEGFEAPVSDIFLMKFVDE